jgi:hypothetical protein
LLRLGNPLSFEDEFELSFPLAEVTFAVKARRLEFERRASWVAKCIGEGLEALFCQSLVLGEELR